MATRPLILEAANLFCDDLPGEGTHLILQELKLPTIEENYVDHLAGGTNVAIEIDVSYNRLEANFLLVGWQPEIQSLINWEGDRAQRTFTAYGLLRDKMTGSAEEVITVLRGRLGRVAPTAFNRGGIHMYEYAIRAITYYELKVSDRLVHRWDFYQSRRQFPVMSEYSQQLSEFTAAIGEEI